MFAQVIVKWVREHAVLPYGVDCTDIGQLRYPFCPPFILHPPLSILNSKGNRNRFPFCLLLRIFLMEVKLGQLDFLKQAGKAGSDAVGQRIVNRGDKQRCDGGDNHTGHHNNTHRLHHLGAFAAGAYHRHKAEDSGHSGHQHRTDTARTCVQDSRILILTALTALQGIVDQHDGRVDDCTGQNDNTEQCDHGNMISGRPQHDHRAKQTDRQDQHDCNRQRERVELRCQNEIYQQDCHRKGQHQRTGGLRDLRSSGIAFADLYAVRQLVLGNNVVNGCLNGCLLYTSDAPTN